MRKKTEPGEVLDLEVKVFNRQFQILREVILNLLKVVEMIFGGGIGANPELDPSLRRREIAPGNVSGEFEEVADLLGLLNLQLVNVSVSNLVVDLDIRLPRLWIVGLPFDRMILSIDTEADQILLLLSVLFRIKPKGFANRDQFHNEVPIDITLDHLDDAAHRLDIGADSCVAVVVDRNRKVCRVPGLCHHCILRREHLLLHQSESLRSEHLQVHPQT